jgi:hypothetical protein
MSLTHGIAYSLRAVLLASTGSIVASLAAAQAPSCPPAPTIDQGRSLVVTDGALDKAKFSFVNTINAILTSLQIQATPENRENFVRSLLASMNDDDMVNPVSGLRMKVDIRALEAGLDPRKLLDSADPMGLIPIALFNRLDLAPQDWSNCGEHRIVYSFKAPVPTGGPPSRFFLIFEARVDNAHPQKIGFEGCRAVVKFWRDLSDENDASKRATRLEDFYYKGAPGVSGPVVQAKNYGGPLGQVRGNLFINAPNSPPKWQLREWIVINSGAPTPASFTPVTVKENPLAEFYSDAIGPNTLDVPLETTERTEFQTQFKGTFLKRLVEPDVVRQFLTSGQSGYVAELDPKSTSFQPSKYKIDILNRIGARFDNRFNEFQSVSQQNEDDPKAIADTSGTVFKAGTSTALNAFVIDPTQKPTIDDVLNRGGAITCGGCHQFAANRQVGLVNSQPISWPPSAGFAHVTENSTLSPALTDVFLPFRADRLREAACIAPSVAASPEVAASAPRSLALENARQAYWQQLVAEAREQKVDVARRAVTRAAVQAITEQRQEETQKPGYFVTNRRPH